MTEIIRETETTRLYKKDSAYYISSKANGWFRRLEITEADAKFFEARLHQDRLLNTVLDVVKARNDPGYYETRV